MSRFLFWLGGQDWFPFSTLRLWWWAVGVQWRFDCLKDRLYTIFGHASQYNLETEGEIDDGAYNYKRICHRCGWSEYDCDCGPLAELLSV